MALKGLFLHYANDFIMWLLSSPISNELCNSHLLPPANEVWCKVIFFRCVCQEFCSQGGVPGQVPTPPRGPGTPPAPGTHTPRDQVHTPPGTRSPRTRYNPPGSRYTPFRSSACWEIRATSGRYSSYWNAFLFYQVLLYEWWTNQNESVHSSQQLLFESSWILQRLIGQLNNHKISNMHS